MVHVDIKTLNFDSFSLDELGLLWKKLGWGWILVCNAGLSSLQVVWLGQIFVTAAQELSAMRTPAANQEPRVTRSSRASKRVE